MDLLSFNKYKYLHCYTLKNFHYSLEKKPSNFDYNIKGGFKKYDNTYEHLRFFKTFKILCRK